MADDLTLDDGILRWLDRAAALQQAPDAPAATAELSTRRAFAIAVSDELARYGTLPIDERARIDEIEIPTRLGPARARRYAPADRRGPLPTQLFLHGGGFVFGSPDELVNEAVLSRRATETGIQLVSLQYALAPEVPYPGARDQAIDALRHLRALGAALDVDASRVGVGGNSAGASLAASAALIMAGEGDAPVHVSLEVPAVSTSGLDASPAEAASMDASSRAQLAESPGCCRRTRRGWTRRPSSPTRHRSTTTRPRSS